MELAVCELERLLNLDDVLDLRVEHERVLVDRAGITDQTDNDGVLAVDRVRLYVQRSMWRESSSTCSWVVPCFMIMIILSVSFLCQ